MARDNLTSWDEPAGEQRSYAAPIPGDTLDEEIENVLIDFRDQWNGGNEFRWMPWGMVLERARDEIRRLRKAEAHVRRLYESWVDEALGGSTKRTAQASLEREKAG